MSMTFELVENLSADAVDIKPVERDWGEGFPDEWDWEAAPSCPECGGTARWIAETDLRERLCGGWPAAIEPEDHELWRCADPRCEHFGSALDERGEGPMTNYAYALPELRMSQQEAADRIRHVELVVVNRDPGPNETYELALSGAGMDFSWSICKAYMWLGYLPPAHFADDLPGGIGPRTAEDAWVLRGARRSMEVQIARAERGIARIETLLAHDPRYEAGAVVPGGAWQIRDKFEDGRMLEPDEQLVVGDEYSTAGTYTVAQVLDEDRPAALGGSGFKTREILRDLNLQALDNQVEPGGDGRV